MLRRKDTTIVFDPPVSDIPESEITALSWEEMRVVALMRYREAGEPLEKLKAWLDAANVYPKRALPDERLRNLDWFAMASLMRAAGRWRDERRDEDHPPGEDGELE